MSGAQTEGLRARKKRVAREAIAKRGFEDKVEVVTGDMFKDAWPTGFDVHLLSNV